MTRVDISAFDPLASPRSQASPPAPATTHTHTKHAFTGASGGGGADQQRQISFMQQQGFTFGLIKAFYTYKHQFPKRCWVLDNSSSMAINGSHRIRVTGPSGDIENIPVTRWEELQNCVAQQSQMASVMQLPTRFALLNNPGPNIGPQYFSIGENGPAGLAHEIQIARKVITQTRPYGATTLSHELAQIRTFITAIAAPLRANRHTISITLATQGLPTNARGESGPEVIAEFTNMLKSFVGLPVFFLIRLCTDDENVFDFYNSTLDTHPELKLDVLDDFFGESLEVYLKNPWLNYALPLHKFRELGLYIKVMDCIDERALTIDEMREFCALLLGVDHLPDPKLQWDVFYNAISNFLSKEQQQWNPVTRKLAPWIDLVRLNRLYGKKTSTTSPFASNSYGNTQQQSQYQNYQQQQYQYHPNQNPSSQFHQRPQPQPQPPKNSARTNTPKQQHVPPPAPFPAPPKPPSTKYAHMDNATLKKKILLSWGLQPPQYKNLKPLPQLLVTVQTTFPEHVYFQKWKPFSRDALLFGDHNVIKRANRQIKFLLHPDKLPLDMNEQNKFICKLLWDILADAWEAYVNAQ